MIEDASPTVIGTIIVCARRLDRLGHLANTLGRGPPDDRDGGGRPHSPVELLLLGATAGAADCP